MIFTEQEYELRKGKTVIPNVVYDEDIKKYYFYTIGFDYNIDGNAIIKHIFDSNDAEKILFKFKNFEFVTYPKSYHLPKQIHFLSTICNEEFRTTVTEFIYKITTSQPYYYRIKLNVKDPLHITILPVNVIEILHDRPIRTIEH